MMSKRKKLGQDFNDFMGAAKQLPEVRAYLNSFPVIILHEPSKCRIRWSSDHNENFGVWRLFLRAQFNDQRYEVGYGFTDMELELHRNKADMIRWIKLRMLSQMSRALEEMRRVELKEFSQQDEAREERRFQDH
jgi:hypothetical protein